MISPFARTTVLAAIVAAATATGAHAASFDCGKATQPDEKAICATPALGDLDVEMATLYRVRMELPMLMGARGAARDDQQSFLDERAKCGSDVACLTQQYNQRVSELNQTIADGMHDYCVKLGIC
jgi:uncharacterized protein